MPPFLLKEYTPKRALCTLLIIKIQKDTVTLSPLLGILQIFDSQNVFVKFDSRLLWTTFVNLGEFLQDTLPP
jgi:hypothetical protein